MKSFPYDICYISRLADVFGVFSCFFPSILATIPIPLGFGNANSIFLGFSTLHTYGNQS